MTAPTLTPAELAALFAQPVIVTEIDPATPPAAGSARVWLGGAEVVITHLYEPGARYRPLWCAECRRVTKYDRLTCTQCGRRINEKG